MTSKNSFTVTMAEAAAMLGVGRSTAYAAAKEGTFPVPVIKVASRYVVPRKALMSLLGQTIEEAA